MLQYHSAFETISENDLPEYRSRGILLRHRKTGCEVYKLVSEDEENSFAFIFRSPPRDATGVAHIVEHSVLCGSEAYPVKDSFLVMSRRSLATFLNAFTWPDKTVYPAASAVPADFFNLLSVYGDAVFHPLLTRETFMQEAHHLEYGADGRLGIKGVVYNEMRGDYSSADSLAGTASSTSLFTPGHPYSWDSGGDPEVIPKLTYEAFRAFWEEHYHPSNCKIFLHGDMALPGQLDFLETRFLSSFEARKVDTEVPVQGRMAGPRRVDVPYPVAEGAEASVQIVVNWLTTEITDEVESFGLELLAEILMGHDGAPLSTALRTSDLGEDLSPQCGLDTVFRQVIFSAGLRGAERGRETDVENLIITTISDFVAKGIPEKSRDAALHSIAFANREIRRGSASYGLRLLFRSLRGWLHGAGPEATLSFVKVLDGYEKAVAADPRWLESLAEKWIISNPHRSTVTVHPEQGLLGKKKAESERLLAEREKSLSEVGREEVRKTQAALEALQDTPDSEEALASLPMLRVADLPRFINLIQRESGTIAGLPLSTRPIFTNGIVYLELAFPLDRVPREAQVWLPFFSRFISGAGLPGMAWGEVAEALALNTGGLGASLDAGRLASLTRKDRPRKDGLRKEYLAGTGDGGMSTFLLVRMKALGDRFPKALELTLRLLASADTGDRSRVGDLLAELGNDITSAIVPAGNSFALARAGASWSEALAIEESWRGTSQVKFVKSLRADENLDRVSEALAELRPALFSREGLRLSLTADPALLDLARASLEKALAVLPASSTLAFPASPPLDPPARHEAWTISAQVGYAASACRASRIDERGFAHESVLMHMLTRGALWDELRVRRGAYGASAYLESLEGVACFSTYRDPRPADAIDWFKVALEEAAKGAGMETAIESVIGASGKELKPLLPEEKASVDFRRELFGIDDEMRQRKRDSLLATTEVELRQAADRLAAALDSASSVLISNEADVQLSRRLRKDTRVVEMPL